MQNTLSDFNSSQRAFHRRRTYVNVVLTELIQGKLATKKTFRAFELPFVSAIKGYHPLFVLQTCASCVLMAALVVYKGFCQR